MDNLRILNITNIDSRFNFHCLKQFKLHKLIADWSAIEDEHLALTLDHISLRCCLNVSGSGFKYLHCKSIDVTGVYPTVCSEDLKNVEVNGCVLSEHSVFTLLKHNAHYVALGCMVGILAVIIYKILQRKD